MILLLRSEINDRVPLDLKWLPNTEFHARCSLFRMKELLNHQYDIKQLQVQLKQLFLQKQATYDMRPVTLNYGTSTSYTIRTKAYKNDTHQINCAALNRVLHIDPIKKIAHVEPRVSMKELLKGTLQHGLTPLIVPELRDITVGGAIMGMAAEAGSHRDGCFNDICPSFEFLQADGTLIKCSSNVNSDLYYGLPGSYGSLGLLTAAEIQLVPAKQSVRLNYHVFPKPLDAVEFLLFKSKSVEAPHFLDGIIFAKNLAVVMVGQLEEADLAKSSLPIFSADSLTAELFYQHVRKIALENPSGYAEFFGHEEYFFRYDSGAFWMGGYLFHLSLLQRLLLQGYLKWTHSAQDWFTEDEILRFHRVPYPGTGFRTLMHTFVSSRNLCKLLHQVEKWVQDRFIIQDFCLPEAAALQFADEIMEDPGVFPLWLLPIKATNKPQLFAPHLLPNSRKTSHFINFGVYGLPSYSAPLSEITEKLEKRVHALHGRKVLYSRSYYSKEEFWNIYDRASYDKLRERTDAAGYWCSITDKVLSI